MKLDIVRKSAAALALVMFVAYAPAAAVQNANPPDSSSQWKAVQDAMGRPGKQQPDGTFKFSMPRKDLKVVVAGTPIKPGLALGSWTAFEVHRVTPW